MIQVLTIIKMDYDLQNNILINLSALPKEDGLVKNYYLFMQKNLRLFLKLIIKQLLLIGMKMIKKNIYRIINFKEKLRLMIKMLI